ncbi:replication initiator protein A [Enterocloster clostridioformis]|uniref:replication initiator protein A n=1 Tax=Enterocloster clostridioformis TaxID=1531 RepID=UPI001C3C4B07|nr:replication initiator protein A [Enterocloster clostridioformis]
MTEFLTQASQFSNYMVFPKFLLDREALSETAKILYMILLDRTRVSQKNDGWTDEKGNVFIYFPITALAEAIHKSEMTVKTALRILEKEQLIYRKRQGIGLPNRIYVKYPAKAELADRNLSMKQTEICTPEGQETVCQTDTKLSGNKNESNKTKELNRKSKESTAYGTYHNVFLNLSELAELQSEIPNYQGYIEKLSNYMVSTGRQYQNHAATIRNWALRDRPTLSKRNYECKEDESL